MTDVRPTPFRAARGSAVALVGLLMALVAHALAGGEVAPGAPTLLASLVVVAGCVLAAGRAWTVGRVVVALAAVQVVVHGTQWVAGAAGPVDPRLARLATDAPAHRHAADLGLTPTMLVAHLAALSLAAACWLGSTTPSCAWCTSPGPCWASRPSRRCCPRRRSRPACCRAARRVRGAWPCSPRRDEVRPRCPHPPDPRPARPGPDWCVLTRPSTPPTPRCPCRARP